MNMISAQAVTIFTLNIVSPASVEGPLLSSLFSIIAKEIDTKRDGAVLQKKTVSNIVKGVKKGQSCYELLQDVLSLFDNKEEISIIGEGTPPDLEPLLGDLAALLS
ncbi:hypothetical protein FBU30_000841, partial [Linnemannia zychae]